MCDAGEGRFQHWFLQILGAQIHSISLRLEKTGT